jgi:hypothetical protein
LATNGIPVKTEDGQNELVTRQRRLSQRHRTLLLLVNGQRPLAEVLELARQAGVPDGCWEDLRMQGLVHLLPPVTEVEAPPSTTPTPADASMAGAIEQSRALEYESDDDDSLPSLASLQPESELSESILSEETSVFTDIALEPLEEARSLLLAAVRSEAPISGSLTVMRLHRARTADDLQALLDEVEARISHPDRLLEVEQLMLSVAQLLADAGASAPMSLPAS